MRPARLTPAELQTLETVADPSRTEGVKRGHLEKLSRLHLIEPAGAGVALSAQGRRILFRKG